MRPARTPTTFSSVRRPSTVCASNSLRDTEKPSDASDRADLRGDRGVAGEPGRRFGYCLASRFIVAYACSPLNASGASVVLSGPCWSPSENASTITASATAISPVR